MSIAQPQPTPEAPHSVGIRALKQNASEVVARAAAGEVIEITDRGRPVAKITPLREDPLEEMVERGQITLPDEGWHTDYLAFEKQHVAELEAAGVPTGNISGLTLQELIDEQREERMP